MILCVHCSSFFCLTTIVFMFYYDYKMSHSEILFKKKKETTLQSRLQARLPRKNINKNENTQAGKNRKEKERDDSENLKTERENGKGLNKDLCNFIKRFHQEFLSTPWKVSEWEKQTFDLKLTSDRKILKGAESSLFLTVQVSYIRLN